MKTVFTYNFGVIPLVDEEPPKECYRKYCGLCDCRLSIHTGGQCHVYELDDGSHVGYIGDEYTVHII